MNQDREVRRDPEDEEVTPGEETTEEDSSESASESPSES
jgi:hypothetical protein